MIHMIHHDVDIDKICTAESSGCKRKLVAPRTGSALHPGAHAFPPAPLGASELAPQRAHTAAS